MSRFTNKAIVAMTVKEVCDMLDKNSSIYDVQIRREVAKAEDCYVIEEILAHFAYWAQPNCAVAEDILNNVS